MSVLYDYIKELLLSYGFLSMMAFYGAAMISFVALIIFASVVFLVIRKILIKIIGRVIWRTKGIWADTLLEHKVFHILTHILPAILIYGSSGFGGGDITWFPALIKGFAQIYLAVVIMGAFVRFLNVAQEIYNTHPYSKDRPIRGYIQLMKILIYFFGSIFIIAVLVEKNPASLFAGLGAVAAVLMLVFRDVILGFVASIQLAANNMVKLGDWITVPRFNADGTVNDISLTTVKVQNWDNTITTIPTYSLVSESVINWGGVVGAGGRRIQRTIHIDMTGIRLCDQPLLDQISKLPRFNEFISVDSSGADGYQDNMNGGTRKMNLFENPTNLSLFMRYIEGYCRLHPGIDEGMARIVRVLQSTDKGLPVELVVFSKSQQSLPYEALQGEIFDHIFALLPEFGLRVFQNPSGGN